jgi:hypothetical protein
MLLREAEAVARVEAEAVAEDEDNEE